ncbi:MAG: leucine-rich repeat domain-containing protein [Prevotella sp.]|nr:leucine-rich repeat domain-containing protein [Prevotella sp.]
MKDLRTTTLLRRLMLAVAAFSLTTTALADDISIPTTTENPFDLTKGVITSNDTHQHFTNNGLEWMIDGDHITFTLQNEQDVDYYDLMAYFDTGYNGVTVDLSLKTEKGDAVADTTFTILNYGWYTPKLYYLKTPAMKKGRYTLVFTFHRTPGSATANIKRIEFSAPESITIPTDDDHPFDLTKGLAISQSTNEHFTEHGVEYMFNNEQLVYSLQCSEDLDICNVYVGSDTNYGEVTLDFSLTSLNGDVVADTTWQIANTGWYKPAMYNLEIQQLKKGKYTLTLTFHQSHHTSWTACNIASISLLTPKKLKPGDNVDIANGEFDNELNGWNRTGAGWDGTLDFGGNNSMEALFNYGLAEMSQTIYNLPKGLYMFRLCAYEADDTSGESYIFVNDQTKPMMNVFDESVGYRSIYRCEGKENNDYRRTGDGRFVPTRRDKRDGGLAMTEHFYENCLVVAVTDGKATFGWKKADNDGRYYVYDHATLTYLSDKTSISEAERAELESKQITDDYKARLQSQLSTLNSQLNNGRPHAPQAIAAANALLASDFSLLTSNNELIDEILRAEHLLQRLQLPFYDITLSTPGTLADQIAALGIEATDTIALKINGTLNDDDFATLKTLNKTMELDLSATTLTAIPNYQFKEWHLLTWITLPSQLETIGSEAFNYCFELQDVQLPASLKTIDNWAFQYTYNFNHVVIPEGATFGQGSFRYSGMRRITLSASMKEMPNNSCAKCYDLIDIQFNGQTNIGYESFADCVSLKTLNVPEGVETLVTSCFANCKGLTSITLPTTLMTIARPFDGCTNVTELTSLAATPPYPNNADVGSFSKEGCTLYVPQQSVEEYQANDRWSKLNIVGIDKLPGYFSIISDLTVDMANPQPANYKPDVSLFALYYYWGNNVSSVGTYGQLTVDGSATFSANRLTTMWSPFALRSMANRGGSGPTHTSIINNGQMRADNITVNLYLYTNCWEFISFPFDVRMGDIRSYFGDVPLVIYGYDTKKRAEGRGNETWVQMTADSTLHAGHGYIWQTTIPRNKEEERAKGNEDRNWQFNRFYVDALQTVNKPKFFRADDVEVKLDNLYSEFAHDRSWNFIGNPYPSYFDIRWMDTTAPIIVWYFTNSSNGQYRAYSPLDDSYILYPGQAFFIQRPLDNDKIVFHREGRTNNMRYDESRRMTRATDRSRQVFNILLQSDEASSEAAGGTLDCTRFVINEAASLDYEPGRDASKFPAMDATATELYTVRDGVRYAIDERPLSDGTVRLGLTVPTPGTYTLALSVPSGFAAGITLIDRETGTETDLTANSYTFQAAAGTTEARFLVRLNGTAVTSVQSVAVLQQQTEQLYDLQGRPVSNPQPGIYVRNNKKVIIK